MSARVLAWRPVPPGLLAQPETPLDWMALSACQYTDPELFFPAGGEVRTARRICQGCEVWAECLRYALENGFSDGVWGGLSERQRRALGSQHLDFRPGPAREETAA